MRRAIHRYSFVVPMFYVLEQKHGCAVHTLRDYPARNLSSLSRRLLKSRVWHSHTTRTFQPHLRNLRVFRLSRSTLPRRLACQKSAFVFGTTRPYLHRCICQKHPWTKTTFR